VRLTNRRKRKRETNRERDSDHENSDTQNGSNCNTLEVIMLLWTMDIQRHNVNNNEKKKNKTRMNTCIKMFNIHAQQWDQIRESLLKAEYQAQSSSDTRYTANRMLCVVNRQSCIPLWSLLIGWIVCYTWAHVERRVMREESTIRESWHSRV